MEDYKIITADGVSLSTATDEMRDKVIKLCKKGWKLQGGASVTEEDYKRTGIHWCRLNQTMVKGKQKLIGYDIVKTTGFCDSLEKTTQEMSEKLQKFYDNGWKLEGGAIVVTEYHEGKSDSSSHTLYQTIIREKV